MHAGRCCSYVISKRRIYSSASWQSEEEISSVLLCEYNDAVLLFFSRKLSGERLCINKTALLRKEIFVSFINEVLMRTIVMFFFLLVLKFGMRGLKLMKVITRMNVRFHAVLVNAHCLPLSNAIYCLSAEVKPVFHPVSLSLSFFFLYCRNSDLETLSRISMIAAVTLVIWG